MIGEVARQTAGLLSSCCSSGTLLTAVFKKTLSEVAVRCVLDVTSTLETSSVPFCLYGPGTTPDCTYTCPGMLRGAAWGKNVCH